MEADLRRRIVAVAIQNISFLKLSDILLILRAYAASQSNAG